jgi:hypothetical protein
MGPLDYLVHPHGECRGVRRLMRFDEAACETVAGIALA